MYKNLNSASHLGLWIIVIGAGIWLLWSALSKRTESNDYSKGATHNETSIDLAVHEYPLSFGCARFDLRDTATRPKKMPAK